MPSRIKVQAWKENMFSEKLEMQVVLPSVHLHVELFIGVLREFVGEGKVGML